MRDVFTAAGWFEAVPTAESLAFGARYARRFGPGARPSAPGESCYEGVGVLAALVNRVGCTDPVRLSEAAADCRYVGPRGPVTVRDGRTELLLDRLAAHMDDAVTRILAAMPGAA